MVGCFYLVVPFLLFVRITAGLLPGLLPLCCFLISLYAVRNITSLLILVLETPLKRLQHQSNDGCAPINLFLSFWLFSPLFLSFMFM